MIEKDIREAEMIRSSYKKVIGTKTSIEKLKEMDNAAKRPGTITACTIGIIGVLVLGFGMCMSMLTVQYFVHGIIVGIVGLLLVIMPYFVYKSMTQKRMNTIASEIIRISDSIIEK